MAADLKPQTHEALTDYDWTGFYVGGHVGYSRGNARVFSCERTATYPRVWSDGDTNLRWKTINMLRIPAIFGRRAGAPGVRGTEAIRYQERSGYGKLQPEEHPNLHSSKYSA
jgi:hypothetical protein